MKTKKVKLIIILLAEIIVSIFNILKHYSWTTFAYTFALVLVIFYVFGSIIQKVINKIIRNDNIKNKKITEEEIPDNVNIDNISKEPKKEI